MTNQLFMYNIYSHPHIIFLSNFKNLIEGSNEIEVFNPNFVIYLSKHFPK